MGNDRTASSEDQPGARRTDDRRVISGIVHVVKTGCRWRPSTTICNRFVAGLCVACGGGCLKRWRAPNLAKVKPSIARPPRRTVRRLGKRGAEAQAIGRSRGGRTKKIHAIVDERGRPIAIEVTPGHPGDVRVAATLISAVPPGGSLAADTAYDSEGLRGFLKERGTVPVIPINPTRKRHHAFDEVAYRQRSLIERMFCRLKDWRRIATRYDNSPANFAAAIILATVLAWWT